VSSQGSDDVLLPLQGRLCCFHPRIRGGLMPDAIDSHELSTIRAYYSQYKRNSIRKNHTFDIPFHLFVKVIKLNCVYCDAPPRYHRNPSSANRGAFMNGLDRYDNSEGYIVTNILPCCSKCNYLKGTLSGLEFTTRVSLIAGVINERRITE
jgi:hypothetical protein